MPACQRGWHLQGQWLAHSVGGRLSVWAVSHHLVFVLCECFLPAPWGRSPVTHWGPLGVLGHSGGQNLLLGVRKGRLCGQGQLAGPSRCTLPPTWAATPGSRQTTHTRAHPPKSTYAHEPTNTPTPGRTHTAAHLEADKPHTHMHVWYLCVLLRGCVCGRSTRGRVPLPFSALQLYGSSFFKRLQTQTVALSRANRVI